MISTPTVLRPNAKINLGLRVLRRRPDGFHDIETVFLPVFQLSDQIEIQWRNGVGALELSVSDSPGIGPNEDNILSRAYRLLSPYSPPSCRVSLSKGIPIGAGLGGGSADGVFFLRELARRCAQKPTAGALGRFALQLGSDCPFFLRNRPAYATGRGEVLQPLSLSTPPAYILLLTPHVHVSTAWAYGQVQLSAPDCALPDLLSRPKEEWQSHVVNDFQPIIEAAYPEVGELIHRVRELGAFYAALSGSGPTVFGLFDQPPQLPPELLRGVSGRLLRL